MSHDLTQYQSPNGDFDDGSFPSEAFAGRDGLPPAPPAWQRYVSALLRRKWVILAAAIIGTGAGIYATRFGQVSYQVEARLWVQGDQQGPNEGPIRDAQLLESSGWLELLKASAILEPVVKEQKLLVSTAHPADRPLFANLEVDDDFRGRPFILQVSKDGRQLTLVGPNETVLDTAPAGEAIGQEVGLTWTPPAELLQPGRNIEFYVAGLHEAGRALGNRIVPNLSPAQTFLVLSMQGPDPEQAAATLNAVADRFVQVATELKSANLVQVTRILREQLQTQDSALSQAEVALEQFRVQTVTLPSEQASPVAAGLSITRDPVFDNFFDLRVKREQLREDREEIERILQQAEQSSSALDGLISLPSVPRGGALDQALTARMAKRTERTANEGRYTPQHPVMQRLNGEIQTLEQQTIPALARELIASLASEEREAERRIGSASSELREIPPRAMEEAGLERDKAIAEQIHTDLRQRYEVARLAAASSVPDIRVLERAIAPPYPSSADSAMTKVAMGFLGGFGLAVLGVILLDRIDPKVRYPEQLTHGMGLPIIGMVPHLKAKTKLIKGAQLAEASEAFREIRLSLLHAHGSAGPVFFTVTSAEPGDGKSFMAANLALAFSQQGYRTLVVDGDIRRGRLHASLGGTRAPGLTDFLAGRVSHQDILQQTEHRNVYLIGSGTRVEVGPELLGSAAMGDLTKVMRSQFDVIILDSPPLGAGIDAYVLGTVSGNLLLVFRTGNTNRSFAQAKLGMIDRLPIRVLGAVLNDVPAGERAYQAYSYLPGYAASSEGGVDWFSGAAQAASAASATSAGNGSEPNGETGSGSSAPVYQSTAAGFTGGASGPGAAGTIDIAERLRAAGESAGPSAPHQGLMSPRASSWDDNAQNS